MKYKVGLEYEELPSGYVYEFSMLIKEFWPEAEFTDEGERVRFIFCEDGLRLTDGGRELYAPYGDENRFQGDARKNRIKAALYELMSAYTGSALPWGILTGVRPTKIAYSFLEQGLAEEEIRRRMEEAYRVRADKARLMTETAVRERSLLTNHGGRDVSLYVGIPFCPSRCAYCSFVSYDFHQYETLLDAYIEALLLEMREIRPLIRDRKMWSFYMGGGTPTILSARQMERLLDGIFSLYPREDFAEITIEAGRPDTITEEKLRVLKERGVERISINPQTMNQKTLERIGRAHTVTQTLEAFALARRVGFTNINMDFIMGLPGEDLPEVRASMEAVKRLRPDSLTVHTLAIKRSSRLHQELLETGVREQTERIEGMLKTAEDTAYELGLNPYYMYRQKHMAGNFENVGYAAPRKECIYNIEIMEERQSIIAFGAGAVSKIYEPASNRLLRAANVKNVTEYLARTEEMIGRKRKELIG